MEEQRTNPRITMDKELRVYTSTANIPYTVHVENMSTKGAFLKTAFLPSLEETITFEIFNKGFTSIYRDEAKVRWLKDHGTPSDRGFGVEFLHDLPEELFENKDW